MKYLITSCSHTKYAIVRRSEIEGYYKLVSNELVNSQIISVEMKKDYVLIPWISAASSARALSLQESNTVSVE